MIARPQHRQHNQPPAQSMQCPVRPKARWRFRWTLLSVPAACLVAAYLLKIAASLSFDWQEVLDGLGVSHRGRERYTQLCALGLSLIVLTAVLRFLSRRRRL